jgi:heme o synthase
MDYLRKNYLVILLKAGRWQLSLAASLATVSGALLAHPIADNRLMSTFTGSFLFALAVTWLNQIQERQDDSRMTRTKNRPLANNTLPVRYAIAWASFCLAVSIPLLFACGGGVAVAILGFFVLFYNCIYTPMKRRSLLALIFGAIAGAAPPVLGWVCAGGRVTDGTPLVLFLLFFLWQVPHFWLFAERNRFDYEAAKFPLPWRSFGNRFYAHALVLWVLAFCVALLALPAFGFVRSTTAQWTVIFMSVMPIAGLVLHVLKGFNHSNSKAILYFVKGDNFHKCHSERSEESGGAIFLNDHSFCVDVNAKGHDFLAYFINFSMTAICIALVAEKIFGG